MPLSPYRAILPLLALFSILGNASAAEALPLCTQVAIQLNQHLNPPVNSVELAETLTTLAQSHFRKLPAKFVDKRHARAAGWSPGIDLWSIPALQGKSIGGDRFGNREQALPSGQWREADLHYRGGKRGAKRLLYSSDGRRFVSVDHYQHFTEIPPCR